MADRIIVTADSAPDREYTARGFSLVEMLIYVALLAVIATAVVSAMLSLRVVFGMAQAHHALSSAAETSLARMLFEIDRASSVATSTSVFGTSPGSLTVTTEEGNRRFFVQSGALRVEEGGVDAGALTPANVSVERLAFTFYENTNTQAVRIELTLHADNRFASTTKTFTTMSVLRNSYE